MCDQIISKQLHRIKKSRKVWKVLRAGQSVFSPANRATVSHRGPTGTGLRHDGASALNGTFLIYKKGEPVNSSFEHSIGIGVFGSRRAAERWANMIDRLSYPAFLAESKKIGISIHLFEIPAGTRIAYALTEGIGHLQAETVIRLD